MKDHVEVKEALHRGQNTDPQKQVRDVCSNLFFAGDKASTTLHTHPDLQTSNMGPKDSCFVTHLVFTR